jgi:prepilin-type N-terminal cleavage/methylation domain-containing protein
MSERKAFTLIELLIVVAIIAILAMIAVPNFLEAQVRAKISRARTDMRTIAVAEEAYRVDWNTYSHQNNADATPYAAGGGTGGGRWGGFQEMTTPIAYMTSIPMSPFGVSRVSGARDQWRPNTFRLGCGNSQSKENTGLPWGSREVGFPADTFIVECDGPDNTEDSTGNYTTGSWPWKNINVNDPVPVLERIYDPTNGTVSGGEVYRTGGQKPAGIAYDVLWAGSAK